MKQYQFLLFDADNTLYDFHEGERQAFREALSVYDVQDSETLYPVYSEINDSLWKQYEKGEIHKKDIFKLRFALFAKESGLSLPSDEVNALYKTKLSEKGILFPFAQELIRTLSSRGYRLFIVTNGDATVQTNRFSKSPITPYFEKIFISEIIGHAKPSPLFFEAVAKAIPDFNKEKALIIGDSETSDIQGANHFGIDACHMAQNSKPLSGNARATYTIHSLEELLPLLP